MIPQQLLSTITSFENYIKNLIDYIAQSTVAVMVLDYERSCYEASILGMKSFGTGFAVDNGVIVTAAHVVEERGRVCVFHPDTGFLEGRVIDFSKEWDTAFLAIDRRIPFLDLYRSRTDVGTIGLVVGYSLGVLRPSAVIAMISSVARSIRIHGVTIEDVMALTTSVPNGMSGGPFFSISRGKVSGMIVGVGYGMAYATPSIHIHRLLQHIRRFGRIRRAKLGLKLASYRDNTVEGLIVLAVERGSYAEKAGLIVGDVLLKANGRYLRTIDDLWDELNRVLLSEKNEIELLVLRRGNIYSITVEFKTSE